ncbi:MAG: hypothetical protein JGK35_07315 [Microcoleus sp. PH2017_16_JOR_D_A]|uniref:hypothetical protein n=1 Tax=Microcoleus sp. PH2017_16_JOR_D_A TaxID=2798827 RepID=UPI001DE3C1FA|nr:hypothetical protein [Microcoleus sp. PH2017_16_JOR_D_A]MCC3490369.1 hypothetical protein [Microcoleus sp. PH2017_16_JOR_D_A]
MLFDISGITGAIDGFTVTFSSVTHLSVTHLSDKPNQEVCSDDFCPYPNPRTEVRTIKPNQEVCNPRTEVRTIKPNQEVCSDDFCPYPNPRTEVRTIALMGEHYSDRPIALTVILAR